MRIAGVPENQLDAAPHQLLHQDALDPGARRVFADGDHQVGGLSRDIRDGNADSDSANLGLVGQVTGQDLEDNAAARPDQIAGSTFGLFGRVSDQLADARDAEVAEEALALGLVERAGGHHEVSRRARRASQFGAVIARMGRLLGPSTTGQPRSPPACRTRVRHDGSGTPRCSVRTG